MISFSQFKKMAENANLVPVFHKILADFETPLSVLNRFATDNNVFLLESVEAGERFGRYSVIGINPQGVFTTENGKAFYQQVNKEKQELDNSQGAFFALKNLLKDVKCATHEELPPLFAGAIGFIGYETINEFEKLPQPKTKNRLDSAFMVTHEMIIFDNISHTMMIAVSQKLDDYKTMEEAYSQGVIRVKTLLDELLNKSVKSFTPQTYTMPKFKSNLGKEKFCQMVDKCKNYIYDGEIIQAVLSQKFSAECDIPPLQLYRALRLINPSPYTFFLKFNELVLVGSSPETLVRVNQKVATLRPIAGTRKRGKNPETDRQLADELLSDEKERAEHLMLVDLGRNDLGKNAVAGSVQVKEFMTVERYSHVMHLVSSIDAILKNEYDNFDLLKATFPAGTLSGAPKILAMEIINELEEESRNTYGGAIGYFSYNQNMDLAITIRTIKLEDGIASIQAGAGIVYNSDPESEYEETCNKAAAMLKAVELASNGLNL